MHHCLRVSESHRISYREDDWLRRSLGTVPQKIGRQEVDASPPLEDMTLSK